MSHLICGAGSSSNTSLGVRRFSTSIFFHASSRTVIFTDLVFNLPVSVRRNAPVFFWILDAPGKFGPHRFIRRRAIRDRVAARQSVERILQWDFNRVIMSHGDVLETGGKKRVAAAFEYL